MMRTCATIVLLALVGLGGCASPLPRTTVVLLPDEEGKVGAVIVATDTGAQRIDQAYSVSTVTGTHVPPSNVRMLGCESVSGTYDDLLAAQPPKPKSFIVRFLLDKTMLTDESKAMIPMVVDAIRARKPTEITIFGHADATGSEQHNTQLSADRANVVAALLREADPTLDRIDVQFFGDRVPLFPSDSGKAEPRNRRAEIMVL